jgi:hypothetical protein
MFSCYAAYIPNTKSWDSYLSTEHTDKAWDEALAEGSRGATDVNDVAIPTSDLEETTGADRVGN